MKRNLLSIMLLGASSLTFALTTPTILIPLVNTSEVEGQIWKYTTTDPLPDEAWTTYNFVPGQTWAEGAGIFGKLTDKNVRTEWQSVSPGSIYLRKTFAAGTFTQEDLSNLTLRIFNDDWVSVYVNGILGYQTLSGWEDNWTEKPLNALAGKAIKTNSNENVIAISCYQNVGGQHIDAGLYVTKPAMPIINTTDFTTPDNSEIWQYTTKAPADINNWMKSDYVMDAAWQSGSAGFGGTRFSDRGLALTNTVWEDGTNVDIFLRKTFYCPKLDEAQLTNLKLKLFYDDDVEVYINGVSAFTSKGYLNNFSFREVSAEAKAALLLGSYNTIAVKVHQGTGSQYVDCGLYTTIGSGVMATPGVHQSNINVTAANGVLTVTGNELTKINIYNVRGTLVQSVEAESNTTTIDISSLATGVYIASVLSDGKPAIVKFIK